VRRRRQWYRIRVAVVRHQIAGRALEGHGAAIAESDACCEAPLPCSPVAATLALSVNPVTPVMNEDIAAVLLSNAVQIVVAHIVGVARHQVAGGCWRRRCSGLRRRYRGSDRTRARWPVVPSEATSPASSCRHPCRGGAGRRARRHRRRRSCHLARGWSQGWCRPPRGRHLIPWVTTMVVGLLAQRTEAGAGNPAGDLRAFEHNVGTTRRRIHQVEAEVVLVTRQEVVIEGGKRGH